MNKIRTIRVFLLCFFFLVSSNTFSQTVTIGSGTTETGSTNSGPIDGYFKSFHYQVVYTAAELTSAGMTANAVITGLGFSVSGDYGGGNLLGYKIRMAHTSEINSSIHNTATLTEVKSSFSYNPTVTAAGSFDMISFTTNFTWNGTSNLLIDICSDGPNPYTSPYGSVRTIASSTTNGSRFVRSDSGTSQCAISTTTINSTKPQIRFSVLTSPCSGTPAPGNTVASVNPVVGGSSTLLSLQNATAGSGVSYQWKSSTDNNTYNTIASATVSTYSATPTVPTYYVCDVTCAGTTTTSNSLQVNLTYCTPTATSSTYYISNFTTSGGIANINLSSIGAASGYINNSASYFCSQFATGIVYISIGSIVGSGTGFSVFIDWNNNYSFADAGEKVVGTSSYTSLNPWTSSFTVPAGTPIGNYRMRVVNDYNSSTPVSCPSGISGEVEDYMFSVVAQPTCMVPTALTSSSISYQTATIGWTAPTSGTAPGNYEYEIRTSGAAGSGATGLVTSGTVSTNSANISGLNGGTTYTYYVRSSCGSGDFSTWVSSTFSTSTCASLPTSITVGSITTTGATISWTAAASGTPAGYEYEVRSSGAVGSGATGLVANGTTTAPTVSASVSGLSPVTTYSVYVRTTCYSGFSSAWTSAASLITYKLEPTNQITNLAAGSVTTTAIPLAWTAATTGSQAPDGYIVKASSTSLAAITDPADGTDPTDVTVFAANAANKKQTTGTSTSTTSFTGHTAGTMYYYKVYSYTNTGTAIDFKTDNVPTLAYATLPNATGTPTFTATNLNSSQATISWSAPSGYDANKHKILVFVKSGSTAISTTSLTANPTTFTANATFALGTAHTSDAAAYCVYNGDGTSVIVTGLTGNTTYQVRVVVAMMNANSNGSYSYSAGATTNGTTLKIEPTNQITNLAAGTVATTSIPLAWTAATTGSQAPDGYLVKASSTSLAAITDPADGTDLTDVTVFTSNAANKKQTTGTSTSTSSFTGMVAGSMYYYKVYSYTNTGAAIDFKTDNVPTFNYATLPSSATATIFSNTNSSSTTLSWTQPNGYNNANLTTLVFIKSGSAINVGSPNQGPINYTANSNFNNGTSYQNDAAAYCVYKGDATDVTVTGLIGSTTYHFIVLIVVEMSNSNSTNSYSSALISSTTTSCNPVSNFNLTFEGNSTLPSCTSFLSGDNLGANIQSGGSYSYPYEGTNCLGLQNGTIYLLPNIDNAHLNTQMINFYARTFSGTGQIGFGYLTNSQDANSYVNLATFNLTTTYQNCNFIPNSIPQNVRIAIKLLSSSVLRVDNISWNLIPTSTWAGTTSVDPNVPGNWSTGTLPTINSNIVIPSSVPNFPTYSSLTIAQGNTFTLQSGAQLTISGTLTNNGTMTIESGATLVQGSSSTLAGTGAYNVKQTINGAGTTTPSGRFWYLGSPVSSASSSVYFASNAANVLKKRDEVNNAWTAITSGSPEALVVGQGYYTQAIPATSTINFTGGLLNNGSISVSGLTRTAGQGYEGFNLVSNPYPSYLNWDNVTRTNVDGTIWYRTHDGSAMVFDTYVAGSGGVGTNLNGTTVSNYIPPMQSFWVRVSSGSTTGGLAMDNTMRSHFTSVNGSVAGLKSTSNDKDLFLRMNLHNSNKKDQLIVYVNDQATNTFDQLDGEKMMQAGYPQFYTKAGDKKIVINGLNSAKKQQALPITMELVATGVHSFEIEDLEISNGLVWLEDKQEELIQALEPGTIYEFYSNAGIIADRFVLHFQLLDSPAPTNAHNEVGAYATFNGKGANVHAEAAGVVVIKMPAATEGATDIQIRDAAGKLVYSGSMNALETSVQLTEANGIYYVTLNSATGVEVKKVFLQQ